MAASSSSSGWLWLAVGLLVVAGAVTWFVLAARSRARRAAWSGDVDRAVGEARWLSAALLPTIRGAASDEERRGAWSVARPRVGALEDRLAVLRSSAPDEAAGLRVAGIASAVTATRQAIDAWTSAPTAEAAAEARGALEAAGSQLEAALPPPPSSPTGPDSPSGPPPR